MRNKMAWRIYGLILVGILVSSFLVGCTEAEKVSYNVSKQADNFNVTRRFTVINMRSDKPILQMVGKMSIEDIDHGVAVIVEIDRKRGLYQKHYIYMNDWTMYTVEDVSGSNVSRYAYEIEFMPQSIAPVRLTIDEIEQDIEDFASYSIDETEESSEE